MINIPLIIVIFAVVFSLVNTVFWLMVLLGPGKKQSKDDAQAAPAGGVKLDEVLDMYKELKNMLGGLKEDVKGASGKQPELKLPDGLSESINKNSDEMNKFKSNLDVLHGNMEKLREDLKKNSEQMEAVKRVIQDVDYHMVKLSGYVEKNEAGSGEE